jgi:hypothetical protein
MKTINFLLGSGIHNGDLPNVSKLTTNIIGFEISSFHPAETINEERIKRFIKLIKERIENYYKGYKTFTTYEDIIFIVDQLIDEAFGRRYNPTLVDFRKNIFRKYGYLETELNSLEGFSKILYDLENIREKIVEIIQEKLKRDEISTRLNSILEIFNDSNIELLNLFTLNHDKEFEKLFDSNNIHYTDGFKEPAMNLGFNKGLKFDINLFSNLNEKHINLFKLHGSVDWYYYGEDKNSYVYKILDNDIREKRPRLIIGTYNKLEQYQIQPFFDIFNNINNELNKTNRLIVSGYGFQDRWINIFVERWLRSKNENKLILIHPNINELLNNNLRETFIHQNYYDLLHNNKIIHKNNKFEDVKWNDIKTNLIN